VSPNAAAAPSAERSGAHAPAPLLDPTQVDLHGAGGGCSSS
jgi:hypothetical protein